MDVNGSRILDDKIKDSQIKGTANIARSKLAQRVLAEDNVPLNNFRIWDAFASLLGATGSSDDLGLYTGTLGTAPPAIKTGDVKASNTTRYARVLIPIPADYEDGETLTIRCTAGMETTVSDTTATIDIQAYLNNENGTVSSDLCATAAQSINSLTAADKDFSITSSSLYAGAMLDVRVAIAINDAATVSAVIGALYAMRLLSDRR